MTAVVRVGWQWAAVEGPVWIAGPDDPAVGIDAERLRLLLREVFTAAGGVYEDWDECDRVMVAERWCWSSRIASTATADRTTPP